MECQWYPKVFPAGWAVCCDRQVDGCRRQLWVPATGGCRQGLCQQQWVGCLWPWQVPSLCCAEPWNQTETLPISYDVSDVVEFVRRLTWALKEFGYEWEVGDRTVIIEIINSCTRFRVLEWWLQFYVSMGRNQLKEIMWMRLCVWFIIWTRRGHRAGRQFWPVR